MGDVRGFMRKIPLVPPLIALTLIVILCVLSAYSGEPAASGRPDAGPPWGATPSAGADDDPRGAPRAQSPQPTGAPGVIEPMAPNVRGSQVPGPTQTVATTLPGGTPAPGATVTLPPAPAVPGGKPPTGGQIVPPVNGNGNGGSGGGTGPAAVDWLRVVDATLTSSHPGKEVWVRCDRSSQVVVTATITVEGGAGDVRYQWIYDDEIWDLEHVEFSGSGPRQQSFALSWPVGTWKRGTKVTGEVQLLIQSPAMSARTTTMPIDLKCA